MPALPYMPFWVGDFLSTTIALTLEQRGGYIMLLASMWNAGGFLPSDPTKLARICGVSSKRWEQISPEILEFFDRDGDRLTQKRLGAEYAKQLEIVEKRRAAGTKGASSKLLKSQERGLASALPNALAKPKQTSSILKSDLKSKSDSESELEPNSNSESESESEDSKSEELGQADLDSPPLPGIALVPATLEPDYDAMFEQWYAIYPKHVDPKDAKQRFIRVLKSGEATFPELYDGARQYRNECEMDRTPMKFIKAPSVFLNKGSWENEPGANSNPARLPRRTESAIEGMLERIRMGGNDDEHD